jgi:GT2 family glycosyltransferase
MRAMGDSATRHAVDVVVPFAGSPASLTDLVARLGRLERGPADTLTLVDNRPVAAPQGASGDVRIIRASELRSSYYARNQGAAAGRNPWLVFLDADVEPPTDLIARYFAGAPGERTAVLAGGVVDEPLDCSAARSAAARYAMLHAAMSQSNTMLEGPWAYAQTANCAVRREAFEAVGGFRDSVRSGGDADLCFRLRADGWAIEPCERAAVVHRSRRTMRELLRQRARHGAGAAWLERQYPGAYPPARRLGLAKWTAQSFAAAAFARVRGRRDDALVAAIKPLWVWAFELGRLFPNEVAER